MDFVKTESTSSEQHSEIAPTPPRTPKLARNRVIQACLPCHHSKRKCDRKKPCSQCLRRHATANCVYESLTASDLDSIQASGGTLETENQTLRSRVADLEAAIADYKNQLRNVNGSNKRNRAQFEATQNPPVVEKDGVYYGQSLYLSLIHI